MTLEYTAPEEIQGLLKPLADETFSFACHPGVPCFTECCRDLKLLLTPYDVLRLKKRLALDASDFHEVHTRTEFDEQRGFPMVFLEMKTDERKTCPFVSQKGCIVYEDRPAACRTYPIARASRMHRGHGRVQEDYYVLHEEHCRGFEENQQWTVEEWIKDQGLESYHHMNNQWMEILTHPRLNQGKPLSSRQQQMFFLACYDLDKFKRFILSGRFIDIFELDRKELDAIESRDEDLLRLSFRWIRFSLCGDPVLKMREQYKKAR